MEEKRPDQRKIQTLVVIIAIVGVLVPIIIYSISIYYYKPKLNCNAETFPLIEPSKQVAFIIIKNEGHAQANNVEIRIFAKAKINNSFALTQLIGDKTPDGIPFNEKIVPHIENQRCTFKTQRMKDNTQIKIFLYCNVESECDCLVNKIIITFDELRPVIIPEIEIKENNRFYNLVSFAAGSGMTLLMLLFYRRIKYR
jgi:hypothetical protein